MKSVEIVSPAGNLEKLKFAVKFGADNVYFGGNEFNLRVQADNFTTEEIKEGIAYCKERGVKTTFLLNSYLHEGDLPSASRYIQKIADFGFDARKQY